MATRHPSKQDTILSASHADDLYSQHHRIHGAPSFADYTLPPSYSTLAFATSSIHKRKLTSEDHSPPFFPFYFSAEARDDAFTSNKNLERISAVAQTQILTPMTPRMQLWMTLRTTTTMTPPCTTSSPLDSTEALALVAPPPLQHQTQDR
ncbi:hypothetical protein PIB30_026150 [Stylosanthes scabra]|uniref:Uncharacterized protein n=1 Tax=Stylosanthes scabra TaxID=79078 RepID=A0ABU6VDE2_9FABA|nr:hypothetical protein [Stylosanthes scabra]